MFADENTLFLMEYMLMLLKKHVESNFSSPFGVSMLQKVVWSHFIFLYIYFFYILKQVPIYFSYLEECCNVVLLWSSRNVLQMMKLSIGLELSR